MLYERGQRVSHYELIDEIGRGGMGVVWKALDTSLGRHVAIKFLTSPVGEDSDRLTRIEREARAVAALNHPNIVTIYSVEQAGGVRFLTMELVEGKPLSTLIPPQGLPLGALLEIAIPLADAINAAHQRGIIHRDLKPANVMVKDRSGVKILDFGLAKFETRKPLAGSDEFPTVPINGEAGVEGTMAYMSPEQIRGKPLDHRCDLFCLGVVLYEMATGRRPFVGETPADLAASILKDTPLAVAVLKPGLPRRLDRLIGRCLEKDPRTRLQTAVDVRNELEELKRGDGDIDGRTEGESVPSIAVLPFTDMSREKDQAYFCDGMVEEIINALAKVRKLRVASRTSTAAFNNTLPDSREIGQRLGVRTLLEGSVRKSGGRLRVAVQLINAADGYELWSDRYDRTLEDVFAIQEEIARSIVRALEITLSPGERSAIRKAPTKDVQAYDYYLRGRKFFYQFGRRDMEFALQLFTRAIELDPGYARAYAGMADCWSYLFMYAVGGEPSRLQADAASRRALELDPDLAEAHASHGFALSLGGDNEAAEQEFETAIQLDPALFEAHYFYARHCFARGQLEKATRLYERAHQVRPEDYQSLLLVAQSYSDLGREAEATEARHKGITIVEDHLKLNPDDVRALYMGANGLVALGECERGLQWAERALAISPSDAMLLYNVACIRSMAGDTEGAIECLDRSIDAGLVQRDWLMHDSNLDPLREHPRFRQTLQKLEANLV